ncbi:MAG: zinc/iron permease [Tindallia sp. MSAO_Bac2]|nr:MAG: zinc/iron permease [Tindallia sp. MSAO_Bac2]
MESLLYSFLAGSSTAIGAIALLFFGAPGKKAMSVLLGFAGGIMLALSVFELMPEALELGSLTAVIIGFLIGCGMMFGVDHALPHAHMSESDNLEIENPEKLPNKEASVLRTGYLIFFGIALHNVPEGLAIGAGMEASPELGLFIAVAIALHNIPEGLAVAGPLRAGGMPGGKVVLFTLGAGLMTVVGTAIGLLIFNISPVLVSGSLAFAAGAMVYIVNDELIPQANSMHSHLANAGLIVGLLLGFAIL